MERTRAQSQAATPEQSVWVNANAGTGKTRVLTDRVLRLLLKSVPIQQIMCLTYTNAASHEMHTRIMAQLQNWQQATPDALHAELTALLQRQPTTSENTLAAQLFTDILQASHRLQCHTIHGFCQSLLQQFPLEAGVTPYFSLADEQQATQLKMHAWQTMIHTWKDTLPFFLQHTHAHTAYATLMHMRHVCIRQHVAVEHLADEPSLLAICQETSWKNIQDLRLQAVAKGACNEILLHQLAQLWAESTTHMAKRHIAHAILRHDDHAARAAFVDGYWQLFMTQQHKAKAMRSILPKKQLEKAPHLQALIEQEQQRLLELHAQITCQQAGQYTHSLQQALIVFETCYKQQKQQEGLLDFDDLLQHSNHLLHDAQSHAWVRYKLDYRLQHILLDESQDTSPLQWRIIQGLVEAFFTERQEDGIDPQPSLMIVGDEKQSIYSFQGADIANYRDVYDYYNQARLIYRLNWKNISLATNFRSAQSILDVADAALLGSGHEHSAKHIAFFAELPGYIQHYPLLLRQESDIAQQRQQLAEQIADHIATILQQHCFLHSKERPVEAGDIMVLVRKRSAFNTALIQALEARHIPVSGADRVVLQHTLLIQDITALLRSFLYPEDHALLASVLAGPFFRCNMAQISQWCQHKDMPLIDKLKESAFGAWYVFWQQQAQQQSPQSFLLHFLSVPTHHQALTHTHGEIAKELIDHLLEHLYHWQITHPGGQLRHFLHDFSNTQTEIKRDMEASQGAVRIMTIHGAKGLEAPIIYLPDTTDMPNNVQQVYWHAQQPWAVPSGTSLPHFLTEAKATQQAAAIEEYERLLYVALTRAQEQLYVFGIEPYAQKEANHWHAMIAQALKACGGTTQADGTLTYGTMPTLSAPHLPHAAEINQSDPIIPAAIEPAPLHEVQPQIDNSKNSASLSATIGTLLHRVLELKQHNPTLSTASIMQHLHVSSNICAKWEAKLTSVMENYAWVMDRTGYSELPILHQGTLYRIDRLVKKDGIWYVIDYKSSTQSKVTTAMRIQLYNYTQAVSKLLPNTPIHTAILWLNEAYLEEVML